ncbi:MAG: VOC family protein [Pseudomonadales bacterium]
MSAITQLRRVHPINFLVRDLDAAIARYQNYFGSEIQQRETLDQRGVKTARFQVGETWIVLVQPLSEKGLPAKHLKARGEGIFLISCQVNDVVAAAAELQAKGATVETTTPRQGLDDWQIIDLCPDDFFGVNLQLVQSDN